MVATKAPAKQSAKKAVLPVKSLPKKALSRSAVNGASANGGGSDLRVVYVVLKRTGDTTTVIGAHRELATARTTAQQTAAVLPTVLAPGTPVAKPRWVKVVGADQPTSAYAVTSGVTFEVVRYKLLP